MLLNDLKIEWNSFMYKKFKWILNGFCWDFEKFLKIVGDMPSRKIYVGMKIRSDFEINSFNSRPVYQLQTKFFDLVWTSKT